MFLSLALLLKLVEIIPNGEYEEVKEYFGLAEA